MEKPINPRIPDDKISDGRIQGKDSSVRISDPKYFTEQNTIKNKNNLYKNVQKILTALLCYTKSNTV